MLSFIKSRRKQQPGTVEDREHAAAAGTSTRYNPQLIDQLTSEHQELLNGIIQVIKAARAFDAPRVAQGLERLQMLLRTHVLTENVRLHLYLKHLMGKEGITGSLVRDFRRDMDEIAREARLLFDLYAEIATSGQSLADFLTEFESLGARINEQMEREECTLFPLYVPEF